MGDTQLSHATPVFSQWQRFLEGHCHHWLGRWARYEPSGQLIESYESERIFQLNGAETSAHQKNLHHKPDGLIVNEWDLHRSQDWGFDHPHCETMVNFYTADYMVFWVPFKSAPTFFGIELILVRGDARVSVFATYNPQRCLSRFTLVREYKKGTQPMWSFDLSVRLSAAPLPQTMVGAIADEYGKSESEAKAIETHWLTGSDRAIIHFPENISFNVP
ncbi:MAG: DUF3598 family protein, partial [Leptolyngbyaceae bacterium]|nr:DUF3598 family protein [Leptolyngbyaceae bacterium]